MAAAAHLANCKTGAKLEKGVCVVHVRRTVVEAAEAGEGAKDAHVAGAIPSSILKPAAKKADSEAAEAAAAKAAKAAVKPTAPAPVPTKAPVPTVAPVATVAPVPTQAPVPTPTPTATAKSTATPAPSAAS